MTLGDLLQRLGGDVLTLFPHPVHSTWTFRLTARDGTQSVQADVTAETLVNARDPEALLAAMVCTLQRDLTTRKQAQALAETLRLHGVDPAAVAPDA